MYSIFWFASKVAPQRMVCTPINTDNMTWYKDSIKKDICTPQTYTS